MEEEKSFSELNKANANIIINNSENNNEIVYNQNWCFFKQFIQYDKLTVKS